jgi:ATP-dependent Lhr-like helicase
MILRKMELRGAIRGDRFFAGVGGEQFAYSEMVDALRKVNKDKKSSSVKKYYCLSATYPLNILNLLLPNRKLSRLLNNRVLYQGGVLLAVIDTGDVHFLRDVPEDQKWGFLQMLVKREFPVKLKRYLG